MGNVTEQNKELDTQEYLQKGLMLLGADKYDDAIKMFDYVLKIDPMNKEAYLYCGIGHANNENYAKAKECFKRAVKIDKKFADAYFQLGNMEFLEGNIQEGTKNYNQAIAYGFHDASLYYNLALVSEEQEKFEEAIRYYSKAANMDESTPEYLIRKASLQITIGKYEESLQTLEMIRNLFPESFEGYHLTTAAYVMLEKYDEADAILKNALLLFPEDRALMFDRMRVLEAWDNYPEAIKQLQDIKDRDCSLEEKKELLLHEAKLKGQMEDLDETKRLLLEALEIKENKECDSEIKYLLLNACLISRDFEKMLEVARSIDKNDVSSPFDLGGIYYECLALNGLEDEKYMKEFQNAVRYYRNIAIKDPARVDAYLYRAMCYKELKEYDRAIEAVDYVLLLQPENGQLHQIKGNILKEQGNMSAASLEFNEAQKYGISKYLVDISEGV